MPDLYDHEKHNVVNFACESGGHFHTSESGILHRCFHNCRNVLTSWQLWLGMTIRFPFEHYIYTKIWPFKLLTGFLGL